MQWTEEQRRAIEARGTNMLLSAAAGSGKTTVLVARVLELIRSGTDIDRMLIVTFTRAASSDMRAKLSRALGARAAEGDERCRSQLLLLERASITTLHGFCADFLRAHFESAGVDPAFRVLDDAELRRLTDDALDQAIEEAYAEPDANLTMLDYARGPKGVRAMVEILLQALDERPDPETWLDSACDPDEGMRAQWIDELIAAAREDINRALLLTRMALARPDCANYAPALERDAEELRHIATLEDYDALYRALNDFKQAPPLRGHGLGSAGDAVKKLRTDAKTALERIALRQLELGTALRDAAALKQELAALRAVTASAKRLLEARKAELAGLSYADLEQRVLRALEDAAVVQELREHYDYIFVDEYQDTSDVQEALIARIARGDNLFMVGDVKQSIYRFRQAEPRLFLKKYVAYGRGEGGELLPLTRNFRSRPAILNFVNCIFERAMHGGDSEITYDERAHLIPGDPECTGGSVELHLLETPDAEADEAILEMKTCEREALYIARRIRELMAAEPSLRYRDIAILTRAKRGVLGRMALVLLQQGIPAFADGSEAYFDSVEIMLGLSLLKLTVNRRSDVELIGVLRSPVVGLSMEQLAQIRIAQPNVPFADAAAACAERTDALGEQLRNFFNLLERWRLLALCTDLGVLTRAILDESGLYDCMGALPGGPQRQANLDRLADNAALFDRNVSGSLTRFLKHTEKLQARGDGDEAHILGENDDVVRLMTVHKSKGLEFPVVFGAMMGRRYNSREVSQQLSVHRDLGLGCLYCDPSLQTRRKTLPQLAIAGRKRRENCAEELRILYVLLTRAQDRLILVGSIKNADAAWTRWEALRETPGAAASHLDVILPALNRDERELCTIAVHAETPAPAAEAQGIAQITSGGDADSSLLRALLWTYPEANAAHRPLKLSVTGLLREIQAPNALEPLIERPSFLSEGDAAHMSGAERGTAYHRCMQLLELEELRGLFGRALRNAITAQLDGFAASGRLRLAQREIVRTESIARFLEGELGQRLLHAREVQREWPFNVRMSISEALYPEEAGGFSREELMVQGTIDCCFMEAERWILIDYKTDREADAEALTLRYRSQLRLYAEALRRITGVPVGEIHLYLLRTGEILNIPLNAAADANVPW